MNLDDSEREKGTRFMREFSATTEKFFVIRGLGSAGKRERENGENAVAERGFIAKLI